MKHIYLLLFFCVASLFANAQIVNIPDPVFKDLLLNYFDDEYGTYLNSNGDGEIQVTEAESFTNYLKVNNSLITDLTGLEAFINMKYFSVDGAQISSINLSQNISLTDFYIHNTPLTNIDLSQNTNLIAIDLANNQLTDIVFPNGVNLIELWLNNNQLTSLDFTNMGFVGSLALDLSNNQLSSLHFNDFQLGGQGFNISNNLFTSIDLSKTYLMDLAVNDNFHLQHINVNQSDGDRINEIYANGCPNLSVICVPYEGYPPTQSELYADQSLNVIFTEDCTISSGDLNQIFGTITFDDESDGCDAGDPTMDGVLVQTTDGTNTFSTNTYSNGFYAESVIEGTFTVSLPNLPNYFSVTPATQSTTFTSFNNTETLDFCVTSSQTINDVNVTLLPVSEARPGFNASYQLVYKNVGTTTLSGDVTLQFDETMQSFISASPTEDASTINSLTFNYSNLEPFESRAIDIVLNTFTPPIVNGGDTLNFTATITPNSGNETPNDNTFTLAQPVVNSFDPNDKQVLQGAEILEEESDEYLDYLIRFQNTGTASAINISVTDVLNDKLDWSSFQMASTSHSYEVNITNGNFVQFVFDGINLPAEQDNEPASHGFIAFKIKPKSDVVIGDIITGQASIYFDFNAPIITNQVSTEVVDSALSLIESEITARIKLFPNPVSNQFKIEVSNGVAINSVEVFDISGKQLMIFEESETYIMKKLTSGVYFIKVKTNQGVINKRIVRK